MTNVPSVFEPVLARLQADGGHHLGWPAARLTPLAYEERPFSYLLRVEASPTTGGAAPATFFVKVFKPKVVEGRADGMRGRVASDFATTKRVYERMRSYPDLGVIPPVACYPDLLTIVTERVNGPTLLEFLQVHARWWPRPGALAGLCGTVERLGRWIRVFQATQTSAERVRPASVHDYIAHRLNRLVQEGDVRFVRRTLGRILQHVDTLCAAVPPDQWRQVPIHSDLALGNVLVSEDRIVVLDFAMAKFGTRLHDLARVCVQLDLLCLKPYVRPMVVEHLKAALLRGFDPSVTPDDPLFRLLVLLHRVNHLTGVSLDHAPFLEQVYNRFVRRAHTRYLSGELRQARQAAEHG